MLNRLRVLAALAALAAAGNAAAQDFPNKPIRLLIPFTPGGGTDFVSRLIASRLGEAPTSWNVVPENRPGAGGNLAIEAAAKSAPDGYTIVMGQTDNVMLGPWLYPNAGYDTVKSFAPIVQVSSTALAIVSAANSRIQTIADAVARGRTPQGLTWGTAGNGTVGHLFGEQFSRSTNTSLVQVHYKGAAPALADVIGGQIDVAILSVASVLPQVRGGKLKALAVTSGKRSPAMPDVPSLDETVMKGTDVTIWLGLFAPVGTPAAAVNAINAEVNKALQTPSIVERMAAQGVFPAGGTSQAFGNFVRADYLRWGNLVKTSGVKLD